MIETLGGENHGGDHRTVTSRTLAVSQQKFLSTFNQQPHHSDPFRGGARLILEGAGKWIAPEHIVSCAAAQHAVHAAECVNSLDKLIAVVPKESPVEIRIKILRVDNSVLPGGCCTEQDAIPTHFKQRLAIVVPGSIQHSQRACCLTVTHKVDDVPRGGIHIGKYLVPATHTGTGKLVQAGSFERFEALRVIIPGCIVPVHNNHVFRNVAN